MISATAPRMSRAILPAAGVAAYGALGAALCVLVFFAPRFVPAGGYPYLAGVGVFLAAVAGAGIVFAPTSWALTLFVVYMAAAHMHNSPFIVPLAGVEWHPREFVLFALLARFGVNLLNVKTCIAASPVHFFVGAFALAWISMALTGLVHGNNATNWIQEARYPLFLASYVALVDFIASPRELPRVLWIILAIAILAALGSIALFCYTFVTGNVITNVQNYLGEYVRRQIGPFLLQSARPNGHQYFEIGTVVLLALLFCREVSARARMGIACVVVVFAAAIAITMMRTAFVATGLGLALLAFSSLPRPTRAPLLVGGLGVVLFGAIAFGAVLHVSVEQLIPQLGVSLRARVEELGGGLEVFQQNPLFGGGLGVTFEAIGYAAKQTQQSYGQSSYLMVHNVWLYYLFKGGLAGFTLALLGLGGIAGYGYRLADRLPDPVQRALARGLASAFTAQCIASLAMPRFNYPTGFFYIALTAVAFVVLGRNGELPKNSRERGALTTCAAAPGPSGTRRQ